MSSIYDFFKKGRLGTSWDLAIWPASDYDPTFIYRIFASTNTCYYSENQVFGVLQFEFYVVKGGATNRDMSLTETC